MATAAHVSRETIEDRLRMATTTTMRLDNGFGVTSSEASRQIADGIARLVNHVVEDGIEYDDEREAFSDFHNSILFDIDRQIIDFADKIENEIRANRQGPATISA